MPLTAVLSLFTAKALSIQFASTRCARRASGVGQLGPSDRGLYEPGPSCAPGASALRPATLFTAKAHTHSPSNLLTYPHVHCLLPLFLTLALMAAEVVLYSKHFGMFTQT